MKPSSLSVAKNPILYGCPLCAISVGDASGITNHLHIVHAEKFKCPAMSEHTKTPCLFSTRYPQLLEAHKATCNLYQVLQGEFCYFISFLFVFLQIFLLSLFFSLYRATPRNILQTINVINKIGPPNK